MSSQSKDISSDVLRHHASRIMDEYQKSFRPILSQPHRGPPVTTTTDSLAAPRVERIAVVGGGVCGLLIAMRLGKLHKVDVYEASNCLGGRLYTHNFDHGNKWDYFDVGAMRFPNTQVMKPTFDLFNELGFRENAGLIKYQRKSDDSYLHYNDISAKRKVVEAQVGVDVFKEGKSNGGSISDHWIRIGSGTLMRMVYDRFIAKLRQDDYRKPPEERPGYQYLMRYDHHTTRSFMSEVELGEEGEFDAKPKYPTVVINWLETRNFAPGWFDRSFSETILELIAFDDASGSVDWYCVEEGSHKVIERMEAMLTNDQIFRQNVKIHKDKRIVRVRYQGSPVDLMGVNWVSRSSQAGSKSDYTRVILTVSPQVMRQIDLTSCRLDYKQKSSILLLQPGPSIKVGMKFKSSWWERRPHNIIGGQSSTDRPVRNVVYPSHGTPGVRSTTLIASYCWTQDAVNMGCWMRESDSFAKEQLKNLIMADLAAIHNISLETIEAEYEDMYAFDWTNNPYTLGAYALFGPGQFKTLLPNLSRPAANNCLHFAGEAISVCHGWVAGSVDSANRVVLQIDPNCLPQPSPENRPETWHGEWGDDQTETGLYSMMFSKEVALLQVEISQELQKNLPTAPSVIAVQS